MILKPARYSLETGKSFFVFTCIEICNLVSHSDCMHVAIVKYGNWLFVPADTNEVVKLCS